MPEPISRQLVVFSPGSEEYGLPVGAVHEVIRSAGPRSVASEVPWIERVPMADQEWVEPAAAA